MGKGELSDAVTFAARVFIAALFIIEGWRNIFDYAAAAADLEEFGLPALLLPAVIAMQVVGGVAILAGFMTRSAALALAVFELCSAAILHLNLTSAAETRMLLQSIAIAGGLLLLYAHGGGRWSMSKDG
jgi:putative oxidoreductase